MRLREVQRLFVYWNRMPPAHELAAAQMGWQDPGPETTSRPVGITDADRRKLDELTRKWGLA